MPKTKPQARDIRLAGYLFSERLAPLPQSEDCAYHTERVRNIAKRSLGEAIIFHQEVDNALKD